VLSVAHRAKGHVRVRGITRGGKVVSLGTAALSAPPERVGSIDLPDPYRPNNQKFRREVARRLERAKVTRPPRAGADEEPTDEHPVAGCPDAKEHVKAARRAARLRSEIDAIQRRIGQETGTIARQFDRVLRVLEGHRFLSGWQLTEDGDRLRRVYHESDFLVALALRDGLLDGIDGPGVAALTSCLTYEHRSPDPPPPPDLPTLDLAGRWERLRELATTVMAEEEALGLRLTREPDAGFAALAHAWAAGHELAEVLADADLSGGDFVRQTRQLIDLLRQVADVAGDGATRSAARHAVRAMDRGVVAAA
jgi:ATP-dependent RNA helicase HelY